MYLVLDLDQVDLEVPVPLVVLAPLVLVDLVDPEVVPIGPGCRTCDRQRCPQRATPPIGRQLAVDAARGRFVPYPLTFPGKAG